MGDFEKVMIATHEKSPRNRSRKSVGQAHDDLVRLEWRTSFGKGEGSARLYVVVTMAILSLHTCLHLFHPMQLHRDGAQVGNSASLNEFTPALQRHSAGISLFCIRRRCGVFLG